MKAFLLAASKGERLRPLTDTLPKCLVSIQSIPLLAIWLELCHRHGISEILVNTHSYPGVVKTFLREHSNGIGVHITEEEVLLGSAGTLLKNPNCVTDNRDFCIFYAHLFTTT